MSRVFARCNRQNPSDAAGPVGDLMPFAPPFIISDDPAGALVANPGRPCVVVL